MLRRRTSIALLSWSLAAESPAAVPNARIALALLRCMRCLPRTLSSLNPDDVGAALAPALVGLLPRLRQSIEAQRARAKKKASDADSDDDSAPCLESGETHMLIGEALSLADPAFRTLFDKTDDVLARFIAGHPHPCDANLDILAQLLSLSAPEVALLKLAAAFCHGTIHRNYFSFVDSPSRVSRVLETLCNAKGNAALRIFDANRALARSGLLDHDRPGGLGCHIPDDHKAAC